ncbi:hypothetical protein Kpol_1023p65 [Vanderwaltozyma polyspora DSM 70294]|uniref:Large ribosomal subunit protein mL40 n=1 Tax=Vanderwaltozyma polyspora (strain ATCC 22028 / DSM 70294 / BCRC 21397 / CBS 2163 / NBRC 10782 / NRRL Y-8283 / UCD 57-17) TaxID=436907 RepID=A7TFT8_VANPO|nr:uncharacterized protein Kpol_1023p65 [Vanderwaltozyma polyspora DSM 70294]EDO18896.1 hypothetical protein Kpol_1023p65 [Vanderwaltozyma polyspora DSM 70294]
MSFLVQNSVAACRVRNVSGSVVNASIIFTRGKRTKNNSGLSATEQRVITQLSVMSASRKQPKLLKLCREDLIKHQTIQRSWALYQQDLRNKRELQLKQQYENIKLAMDTLKNTSPELYEIANKSEEGRKFPLEMKIPSDFPAKKIWHYTFRK